MKFGGTSVGDASCIKRVVEIIQASSQESHLVVVVSAMSGVTNRLLEAAVYSQNGNYEAVRLIFEQLLNQHQAAADALISSPEATAILVEKFRLVLDSGEVLCQNAAIARELTLPVLDAIAGVGERLSAPLVSAALVQFGTPAEAVDGTEVIVTDGRHGAAEPLMDLTRERCEKRLRPLLQRGTVPVVTGFIGATTDAVLTTLGRGGSDYSAAIVGAALNAEEVVIWTDVDGILTADPRVVGDARSIPEISYHEAAKLAHFGAKVLHPKTLRPVAQANIPVWIRNTFSPEKPGTKVHACAAEKNGVEKKNGSIKALTSLGNVSLITLRSLSATNSSDILRRAFSTTEAIRAEVLVSEYSAQNGIRLVISSDHQQRAHEALSSEFAGELTSGELEPISADPTVAILTLVSQAADGMSEIGDRASIALQREKIEVLAFAQGASECTLSLLVSKNDLRTALHAVHREFQLGANGNGNGNGNGHVSGNSNGH